MPESIVNIIAAAVVFAGTLIKIPKLELNVWGLIGRAMNKELNTKLDMILHQQSKTAEKLDEHIAMDDERYAVDCRARILRFNDEILHGQKHTKEHFDQTLSDITTYNSYCDAHKDFKNQITIHATENILKTYDTCMEEHSFL